MDYVETSTGKVLASGFLEGKHILEPGNLKHLIMYNTFFFKYKEKF